MKTQTAFDPDKKQFFTDSLLRWHASHHRPLPWKGEKNPYLVWLSEIILQQTRVEQGLPYFEKFSKKYPTVHHLANAPEDEVMKMWEGLGYYSRARNLHAAAKYIANELGGQFPHTYEGIRALKGVGDYTAAAIASFAFDLPHAVVDGNVYRVLSRYFGIEEPVDTTAGKKLFAQLAQELIQLAVRNQAEVPGSLRDGNQQLAVTPGKYNQAIMDFGAGQCTPAAPKCTACPMRVNCAAFHQNKIDRLPMKSKKLERRQRFFNYLVINQKEFVFVKKRTEKDIWRNLYDFPLIETEQLADDRDLVLKNELWTQWLGGSSCRLRSISPPFQQELTHQRIVAVFWEIELMDKFYPKEKQWTKTQRQELEKFALPKVVDLYLKQKFLPLELF